MDLCARINFDKAHSKVFSLASRHPFNQTVLGSSYFRMTVAMTEQKQELSLSSEHVDEMPVKAEEAISNGLGMPDEQYDANEKSLVRKLDFTLLPMVWLLYFFNYLDRNNIA